MKLLFVLLFLISGCYINSRNNTVELFIQHILKNEVNKAYVNLSLNEIKDKKKAKLRDSIVLVQLNEFRDQLIGKDYTIVSATEESEWFNKLNTSENKQNLYAIIVEGSVLTYILLSDGKIKSFCTVNKGGLRSFILL